MAKMGPGWPVQLKYSGIAVFPARFPAVRGAGEKHHKQQDHL